MPSVVLGLLMMATAADQGRRGAAPVPQAVVLVKIYGCLGGAM